MKQAAVSVVGIGDDGCLGLSSRALGVVAKSRVLVGGARQLAFFPEFSGERIELRGALEPLLERIAERSDETSVCVLASGDPLFFGIGKRVIDKLGAEHVSVLPHPSSIQWAFARAGLPWHDAKIVSLHGRSLVGLVARLKQHAKAALLTDPEATPARIATHLIEYGDGEWHAWVCENLAGPGERVRQMPLRELLNLEEVSPLNVLILVRSDPEWRPRPVMQVLHEDAFAKRMPKKGLITKREVRLLTLSALNIRSDSVVWDIGAGSGSVAVEAGLLAPEGRVYAIEVDPEGVELCRDNARAHGADNVSVVAGLAPDALAELEAPDAVFVGGSKGALTPIVSFALERLRPGGSIVINAITLENVGEAERALSAAGVEFDVTLLQVSRAVPLARYKRYEALNPIQIFSAQKPRQAEVSA